MAVAMDLGDPSSPFGSIHPRDKETVGERLALAGGAIAYGETDLYYTGPIVDSYENLVFTFRNFHPLQNLDELRSSYGFEIGCTRGTNTQWLPGTAEGQVAQTGVLVEFPQCPQGFEETAVRYSWMEDPCPYLKCAVYSGGLPSPPFLLPVNASTIKH